MTHSTLKARFAAWLDRWADRLVSIAGAVVAAQGPEFMQQYLQRLGGHVDEARRQVELTAKALHLSGEALAQWLATAAKSDTEQVRQMAVVLQGSQERLDSLLVAQTALREANVWSRPFAFLAHLDTQVLSGTWADYQPAVPTTGEGAVYALAGILVALGLYHFGLKKSLALVSSFWMLVRGRKKARPPSGMGRA